MATIWRLLTKASTVANPPPVIDSDEVYPVFMLDGSKTLRSITVAWTLRFNDVLDADKLHASLSKLLDTGDWRKIGGRLRLKQNGELEIHVPRPFTADRPAVSYTHQTFDMAIEDDPIAKLLPKATNGASLQSPPELFRSYAAREDVPATFEDFIQRDTPQLSLHISSFHDATLVGLSWPHSLMDVMGQHALLHAWSLVLAGRESEVPPLLGARDDPMSAAADASINEKEEFGLAQKRLKGAGMLLFGLRFAWDMAWNSAAETRSIFLPKSAVSELQRQAQEDLIIQNGSKENTFVSEGDVLTAWAIRAVASSLPQPRPVAALHAINARFRVSALNSSSGLFIQNMAVPAFTFLSPESATGPLGTIALANRTQLMQQSTEGQVLAFVRDMRADYKPGGDLMLLCGESDAVLVPFTNWTRAKFFSTIQFGPAVQQAGEIGPPRSNPPGTIVYHHAHSLRPNPAARNVIVITGKDHGDNYWLTANLLPAAWVKIEEEIQAMSPQG